MQRHITEESVEELIRRKVFGVEEQGTPIMDSTCQAMVVEVPRDGKPILRVREVPIPVPGEHQARVRVFQAAQNPTDVSAFDINAYGDGAVHGCDFAGIVEAIGPGVTRLKGGDKVAGVIWGGNKKGLGAFAERTLVDERISFHVPSRISLKQAATVPLASLTALLALFSDGCLNLPKDTNAEKGSGPHILIWGGSSSVGLYAIQIAHMHGFRVITTCSPRHENLVKSLGAKHVFDYKDPDVVSDIERKVPDLKYFFDTIGSESSTTLGGLALGDPSPVMCTVRPGKAFTENLAANVKATAVLMWTAFGEALDFRGTHWPANPRDHELARDFCEQLPGYLACGMIKPNQPRTYEGGLDAIPLGFQDHRDGKISGFKIVYQP